jgi:NAD(P)-dependent dehydrogenase (short-subunit alcohol dehydrogenase family)
VGAQRAAVVTGGAGGIGAAIAEVLGSAGAHVVTMDPVVSVDGAERLPEPEETTASRIVSAGGSARSSSTSVTDRDAVREVFDDLVGSFGGVDAVVNVAGISRPTGFAKGAEKDWVDVIGVHLEGYLNVLSAALPHMAAAGRGRIVGVTSGSGWRAADTGAYGCAKRAVASLTWQLGAAPPEGVTVNALSPIAATRMVMAALGRPGPAAPDRPPPTGSSATGGLALGNMPSPQHLGPIGAWLASDDDVAWCSGQVLFSGGSEVVVIGQPALVEIIRTDGVASLRHVLEEVTAEALVGAERAQMSSGGGNSRFGPVFDEAGTFDAGRSAIRTCAVAVADPVIAAAVTDALRTRGIESRPVRGAGGITSFEEAASALAAAGSVDAAVTATGSALRSAASDRWQRILDEHAGIADDIVADAAWARACADRARADGRPLRLVQLLHAGTAGGRSRAQAATQLSRAARGATDGRVAHFVVSVETETIASEATPLAELGAHLLCDPETEALSGAELALGPGWLGIRRHPQPTGSITFGGPRPPAWLGSALREVVVPAALAPYEQELAR